VHTHVEYGTPEDLPPQERPKGPKEDAA
jgi:hypothetical protein